MNTADETEKPKARLSAIARYRTRLALAVLGGAGVWVIWSWVSGGLVSTLVEGARAGDSAAQLESLRVALDRWGPLAPVVYVAAVVLEVLIAPIPGTLLYAPAGALFGGLYGGFLSLLGNTFGAMAAAGLARALGEDAVAKRVTGTPVERHVAAIRARAFVVILLLRLNPLTSSDLVSYAAGAIGVPIWKVGLATFIGMAPLCFAQAYLAQEIFSILPGGFYVLIGAGLVYVAALVWWLAHNRR